MYFDVFCVFPSAPITILPPLGGLGGRGQKPLQGWWKWGTQSGMSKTLPHPALRQPKIIKPTFLSSSIRNDFHWTHPAKTKQQVEVLASLQVTLSEKLWWGNKKNSTFLYSRSKYAKETVNLLWGCCDRRIQRSGLTFGKKVGTLYGEAVQHHRAACSQHRQRRGGKRLDGA